MMPEHLALQNDASMLTKRFGKEIVNYYAGGRLNRYSFLRSDPIFLSRAVSSPASRFIALDGLNPLVSDRKRLAYLTLEDVEPLIGSDPFPLSDADATKEFDSAATRPLLVFLGTVEGEQAAEIETTDHGVVKAQPFFAVDVTPKGPHADAATAFLKQQEDKGLTVQTNARFMTLGAEAGM